MDKPHPKDYPDSHNYRSAYSAWHAARIAEAKAELGPAECFGEWVITDNLGIEPERRTLTCRRSGVGWHPPQPESLEKLGPENHPGWKIRGERVYPSRFAVCLEVLAGRPVRLKTREELESARSTRKPKEVVEEGYPLFAGLEAESQ